MDNDRLRELLAEADATSGDALDRDADFAPRVRAIGEHRRRRRIVLVNAAVVGVLIAAVVSTAIALRSGPAGLGDAVEVAHVEEAGHADTAASSRAEIERLKAELARLNAELALRETIERRLAAEDELRRLRREPMTVDTPPSEYVAGVLLHAADVKREFYGLPEEAKQDYESIVERYPETSWAVLAGERLAANGFHDEVQIP